MPGKKLGISICLSILFEIFCILLTGDVLGICYVDFHAFPLKICISIWKIPFILMSDLIVAVNILPHGEKTDLNLVLESTNMSFFLWDHADTKAKIKMTFQVI
jgi:hypothetical protein